MKLVNLISVALISVFLFTGCGEEATTVIEETPSIEELRAQKNESIYNLTTTNGESITFEMVNTIMTSKDLNGKVVLLNFFATWCPPCLEEIPIFNKLAAKYPEKFKIVSVLAQDPVTMDELKAFMNKHKINFTVTFGDENNRLAKNFNDIKRFPESYLYTKDGVMIKKYLGVVNEEELEQYIIEESKNKY